MIINEDQGKYVKKGSLEPTGRCDRSGFLFSRSDLKKQMEWRGNKLVWTGLLVGKPFLDEPNPQNRPPRVVKEDLVVKNPRPMYQREIEQFDTLVTHEEQLRRLNYVDFTKPNIPPVLVPRSGPDISNLTPVERRARLDKVRFNEN